MSNYSERVPDWMTLEYFQDVVQNSLKGNLKVQSFRVSPASSLGENFTCQVLRVEMETDGRDNVSLIAKFLPDTELSRQLLEEFDLFGTEKRMFWETLPRMLDKCPDVELSPRAIHMDEERQTIYLEDLKERGFRMYRGGAQELDLLHSLVVVKALASFHASSFLLEREDPRLKSIYDRDPRFTKEMKEANTMMVRQINSAFAELLSNLHLIPVSEQIKTKIRALEDKVYDEGVRVCAKRDDSLNALLHGDCWVNNLMFRYHEGSVDVKLLDYQMCNYNSIGLDLNFFIFGSTSLEVKTKCLEELLTAYHKTFVGVTGDVGFGLDTVRREFQNKLFLGFICSSCLTSHMVTSETSREPTLSAEYLTEMEVLLPFFEQHGVLL